MRVLLVSPLPPPEGGIATWTKQYIEYCSKSSIEIDVCVVNIAVTGERLKKINNKRNIIDEIGRTWNILCDLRKKISSFNPDVVHVNSSCAKMGLIRDGICICISKIMKKKVVLHCRCTIEDRIGTGWLWNKIFIWVARISNCILVLNKSSECYVKGKIENANVEIIPNFITLKAQNKKLEINEHVERIIFVGHVQFDKGVREIFEVANTFPQKKFILIGPISSEVGSLMIPQNLELLGALPHEKVNSLLTTADLFLFPSYTEGFSNSLVEAMASGLPIIASNVGANMDMIENMGGYIVPAKNYESIIHALQKIDSTSERKKMSVWNQQKVYEKYRIEIVMEKLLSIYQKL